MVLYAEALTEASIANGNLRSETGLLRSVREILILVKFDQFGRRLLAAITTYRRTELP